MRLIQSAARLLRAARLLCLPVALPAVAAALLWMAGAPRVRAQNQPSATNSNPTYQALRNLALSGGSVAVSNFEFKRDAASFHLHSGMVCFAAPVAGKVTGAVFVGDGSFTLDPPAAERGTLKLLTKEDEFNETFSQMVLRFTDSTYDEIKRGGSPASGGCDARLLRDNEREIRTALRLNLDVRILQDVLADQPGGLFLAFVRGKRYNGKELFSIEPHGVADQVQLMTLDENKLGVWASFPLAGKNPGNERGERMRIERQQLDTTLEGNGNLTGVASTTFTARMDGLRVVSFDLFPTLRVDGVTSGGQRLDFIQEDKDKDGQFAVILPQAMAAAESRTVTVSYSGKDAVQNEGNGNYYPASRSDWYPNNPQASFGEFVPYDMTFRIPKGMKMAATGQLLSERTEGSQDVTMWKSEAPQTVAGFNFGKFKVEQAKVGNPEFLVQAFANENPPNWVEDLQRVARAAPLGTMSTPLLNKKALAEAQVAVQVYNDYFGPPLFRHLQITQQTACNYGQSWPGLVWIPICYYFDSTVRHLLGLDAGDGGYWKVVTPHEVAHQWWGNTVGFASYRDQWMSEGFADMSASLYLTAIDKNPQAFINFWNDERDLLLERNAQGFRAIDAGALIQGYRLSNSRTGFDVTRRLIYPKGAFILHMIRMMMKDNPTGDQHFREMMQDFVQSYAGKSATTEDFKRMVEKHMTAEMNLAGNRRMDWFFDEYVYGTQLPAYRAQYSFGTGPDGTVVLDLSLAQSNVNDDFRMLIPLYLELSDGKIVFLGRARMAGSRSVEQKIPLRGLTTRPRRLLVNYFDDVLASPGQ